MLRRGTGALALLLIWGCAAPPRELLPRTGAYGEPVTRAEDVVDRYHGVDVADPYRWLEDLDGSETRAWIEAQNRATRAHLDATPDRERLQARLTELWNYERFTLPFREGGRYFYRRNDGLQAQSVVYVAESLDAPPRVLLNPNTLSSEGTVSVAWYAPSRDGRRVVYGLSRAGSDWKELRVRDVDSGVDLPDRIPWVKFSGASWAPDGSGFYYSRYPAPPPGEELAAVQASHTVHFHRLGDDPAQDKIVYARDDTHRWLFQADVSEDGRYLVLSARRDGSRENGLFYRDLESDGEWVELFAEFDATYSFVDSDAGSFWIQTDFEASRGRLVRVRLDQPEKRRWRDVIPESEHTLRGVRAVGEAFVAPYLVDARSAVHVYDRTGGFLRELSLPGVGTAWGFGGRRDSDETFFGFVSFTKPASLFRLDVKTGEVRVWREPSLSFDATPYVTHQVFYRSPDGTQVPMFLTYRRDLARDGTAPVYLYGYGGFRASLTPTFSAANAVWLELGGIIAVPSLRGGGEYGEAWHRAAMGANKQRTFDDFIAAADWLVDHDYTRPERIAIAGRSNGGLLVGAVLTQAPEKFGAALVGVGVLDMIRFPRFTIGWAWQSEYGSPDDAKQFAALLAYSPLHNLKPGTSYPATLVHTADHDDRVVPAHSYKFTAALQAASAHNAPALIRVDVEAGHGGGTPTQKRIDESADLWTFVVRALDVSTLPLAPDRSESRGAH